MSVTVTTGDLRNLLNSGAESPVLYVNFDVDYEPELDVWAGAYVDRDNVVITQADLEDWLGDDWTDADIAEYLPQLQDIADNIAPAPGPHFTAWLTTSRDCLDSDDCDITVRADDVEGWKKGKPVWSSTGEPLLHALTGVPADGDDEEAQDRAEELLAEAGWSTGGTWEAVGTGYVVTVERARPNETWTLQRAADHMGAASTNTADQALRRLGVKPVGRAPGRGGQNLYNTAEVMYAHATRPGRGARTDLKGGTE